ncbi:MAG: hypothetical protein ACD_19C00393G0001, partial [uncultured bacterium]
MYWSQVFFLSQGGERGSTPLSRS